VPLSHGNLAASLANIVATYELAPADRSLLVMPLFHVHGLMAGALPWVLPACRVDSGSAFAFALHLHLLCICDGLCNHVQACFESNTEPFAAA
jgi:acyl-CoA synthetase (AMP-forming)/AMP-acid ligase II